MLIFQANFKIKQIKIFLNGLVKTEKDLDRTNNS